MTCFWSTTSDFYEVKLKIKIGCLKGKWSSVKLYFCWNFISNELYNIKIVTSIILLMLSVNCTSQRILDYDHSTENDRNHKFM